MYKREERSQKGDADLNMACCKDETASEKSKFMYTQAIEDESAKCSQIASTRLC